MRTRISILLIAIALWDCIDDQCVASLISTPGSFRALCYYGDDDSFFPFSFVERGRILRDIRWVRFTPALFQPIVTFCTSSSSDSLYLLMSLQL
jgi:hypothetical protein